MKDRSVQLTQWGPRIHHASVSVCCPCARVLAYEPIEPKVLKVFSWCFWSSLCTGSTILELYVVIPLTSIAYPHLQLTRIDPILTWENKVFWSCILPLNQAIPSIITHPGVWQIHFIGLGGVKILSNGCVNATYANAPKMRMYHYQVCSNPCQSRIRYC